MIGSLVRWFGRGANNGQSGHPVRAARRYTPRVNALENRMLCGGLSGGVITTHVQTAPLHAQVSAPSHVIVYGSKVGGTGDGVHFDLATALARSSGEEIPQW